MTTVRIHKRNVCIYCSNDGAVAELFPETMSNTEAHEPPLICLECLLSVAHGMAEVVVHDPMARGRRVLRARDMSRSRAGSLRLCASSGPI